MKFITSPASDEARSAIYLLNSLLIFTIFIALFACSPPPSTDSRTREYRLADGTRLKFYHERPLFGSDHAKYLEVTDIHGHIRRYTFGDGHSGYDEIFLYVASGSKIWIVEKGSRKAGMFLDLKTGLFFDESEQKPVIQDAIAIKPTSEE